MTAHVQPHWGRSLDLYKYSFGIDSARQTNISADDENRGRDAIDIVCQLAIDAHQINSHFRANDITLATLESIIKLSLSPTTLHLFDDPTLLGGCVRLMSMVKPQGKPSVGIIILKELRSCYLLFCCLAF
jgi:hypothetical protein